MIRRRFPEKNPYEPRISAAVSFAGNIFAGIVSCRLHGTKNGDVLTNISVSLLKLSETAPPDAVSAQSLLHDEGPGVPSGVIPGGAYRLICPHVEGAKKIQISQ